MTDQDKILLMSYLDNELNANEISEVESLISNDSDAQDYLNQLKMTNNEVDAFFSSEDMKLLDVSVSQFVKTLKPVATSSFQLGEVISSFFFSRQLVTYSLTAMIFLTAGLFYNDGAIEELSEEAQPILFDLNQTLFEKQVFKTRGLSSEVEEIKDLLTQTIDEMVSQGSAEGNLVYGTKTYAIFLKEKTMKFRGGKGCYSGNILFNGESSSISFCKAVNDTSLIFTD
ncbi:hypothetical protein OAO26_05600 [Gammaproteobacteria bacterium]|nr:hypothetical protein [Gammaproteobacteria bacterium]